MTFSYNDLKTRARTVYRASASANAIVSGALRVFTVQVAGGAAAGDVEVHDSLDAGASANIIVQVNTAINDQGFVSFEPQGVRFATGLSTILNGTPDGITITYMAE